MKSEMLTGLFICLLLSSASISTIQAAQEGRVFDGTFFEINIITRALHEQSLVVQILQRELAKIGIKVTATFMEYGAMKDLEGSTMKTYADGGWDTILDSAEFPMGETEWYTFHSKEKPIPGGYGNWMGFYNGKADRLMDLIAIENDVEKRKEYTIELQKIFLEEQPHIVLWHSYMMTAFHEDVQGTNSYYHQYEMLTPQNAYQLWVPGKDTLTYGKYFLWTGIIPVCGLGEYNGHFETLIYYDYVDNEFRPLLAESMELADDGKTWTIHLKENVKWSDGVNFTSRDVKFTLDSIVDPDSIDLFRTDTMDMIESLETPDNYTVVIHMRRQLPDGTGLRWLLCQKFGMEMLPYHVLGGLPVRDWKESDYNTWKAPIPGTGPYIFHELKTGEYIKYKLNEYYHTPPLEAHTPANWLFYKNIPEATTAIAALEVQEIDIMDRYYRLGPQYDLLVEKGFQLVLEDTMETNGLYINFDHPILTNKFVRQAISMAFSRREFVDEVINGVGYASQLMIWPKSRWYDLAALGVDDPPEQNIEEAQALMELAGYKYEYLTPHLDINYLSVGVGIAIGAVVVAIPAFIYARRKRP